jgi:hypothetical protein
MFNYLSFSVAVNTKHLRCSLYREHFVTITLWSVINVDQFVFGPAMFLLYHSEGCNICGGLFRKSYINDLHTTTCSGMLGHRTKPPIFPDTKTESKAKTEEGQGLATP